MRAFLTCIICTSSLFSYAQREYGATLSARLQSIRKLNCFNNTVVLFEDSVNSGMEYPYWKAQAEFYKDDVVKYKYRQYLALTDSKGKQPDISPKDWEIFGEMSPYLFLKDTRQEQKTL